MNNTTVSPNLWVPVNSLGITDMIAHLFFSLLAIITLICNVFVLLVLHRGRNRFDEVMRILLQSLAVTDLIGGTGGCVLQALHYTLRKFPSSTVICKLVPFSNVYLVLQSLYIVCLINMYRLLCVVRPLTQVRFLTPQKVRICVVLVKISVLGFVLPLLPLNRMPFSPLLDLFCDATPYDQRGLWIPTPEIIRSMVGTVATTIIAFVIPLLTLTFTNARLIIIACQVVHRKAKVRRSQTQSSVQIRTMFLGRGKNKHNHQDNTLNTSLNPPSAPGFKGLRTVIVVTGLFYLSCIPFCIMVASMLESHDTVFSVRNLVSILFLMSNAWWNGPVFMYTSRTFRKEAVELSKEVKRWLKVKCMGETLA